MTVRKIKFDTSMSFWSEDNVDQQSSVLCSRGPTDGQGIEAVHLPNTFCIYIFKNRII